jgi:transposase-like protein
MKKKGRKMHPRTNSLSKEQHDSIEALIEQFSQDDSFDGLKSLNEAFLNLMMKKEREAFLRNTENNKGNGFYPRSLSTGLGKIDLMIPRDRLNEFRPFLLPEQWQRGDQSYDDLLNSLIIHAYSPNKIRSILKSLNLSYSDTDINEIKDELFQRSNEFKTRELNADALCIYIDAYHTQIKDPDTHKVTKAAIYSVIGIDLDGKKEVYGYYEHFGSETKEHWLMILNDLIKRGLKRLLLIISDDFPGLSQAIQALFSKTEHQLCFVHMQRNVHKNMGKSDSCDFNNTLKALRTYKDKEKAVEAFATLCENYRKKYPTFIDYMLKNKERYFAFLGFPNTLQKHIYTTNPVENFNSRLEVMRINIGGYFQTSKTLNIAMQVLIDKLSRDKWRYPVPIIKGCQYEIYQLFNQRFLA